jgi:signal peptidase I
MSDSNKFLLNVAALLVIAGVLARLFLIEVVDVHDNGMAPTLVYGDRVLVWKGMRVGMSDVVVCQHPARDDERVIGRALVFAGHRVHADYNGQLYVDDQQSTTQGGPQVRFYDVTRTRAYDMVLGQIDYFGKHDHEFFLQKGETFSMPAYTVEKGVYLLGDNRSDAGFDSREFGEVDPARCLGQVFMRWQAAPATDGDTDLGHHRFDIIE